MYCINISEHSSGPPTGSVCIPDNLQIEYVVMATCSYVVPEGCLSLCDNFIVNAVEMNATDMMNDGLHFI